jgi:C_GCAxxG_C_C family probable redox protein
MNKEDYAIDQFKKGYNCAQSVLTAFHDEIEIDEKDLLKIASGFGGGMGHLQLTCGAVTGAFMVISLTHGYNDPNDRVAKDKAYSKIVEFERRFKELNSTTGCRELLGADFNSEEGRMKIITENLHERVCHKAIKDAVSILRDLII